MSLSILIIYICTYIYIYICVCVCVCVQLCLVRHALKQRRKIKEYCSGTSPKGSILTNQLWKLSFKIINFICTRIRLLVSVKNVPISQQGNRPCIYIYIYIYIYICVCVCVCLCECVCVYIWEMPKVTSYLNEQKHQLIIWKIVKNVIIF